MLLYVLALEPSGDLLGGKILEALKNQGMLQPSPSQDSKETDQRRGQNAFFFPEQGAQDKENTSPKDPSFFTKVRGLGGPAMEHQGSFQSLWSLESLSSMGLRTIFQEGFLWRQRHKESLKDILQTQPKLLLTIDSPAFTLPLAAKVKKIMPSVIHLHVHDPALWSKWPYKSFWDLRHCDGLLSLFPRPQDYRRKIYSFLPSLGHIYVGHPLWDKSNDDSHYNDHHSSCPYFLGSVKTIGLFPGSRPQEIKKFFPILLGAAEKIFHHYPSVSFRIPFFLPAQEDLLRKMAQGKNLPLEFYPRADFSFSSLDLGLGVSGTLTLDLMKHTIPMIIGYKVHPLTAFLAKTLLAFPWISLVNLLGKKEIIPECLQRDFSPEVLVEKTLDLMKNSLKRLQQKQQLRHLQETLDNEKGCFFYGSFKEHNKSFGEKCADAIKIFLHKNPC